MTVWQVAAGDGSRDYSDVFLKFGVVLVGPGSEGTYFSNKDIYNDPNSWAYHPFISLLAEAVKTGDLVVLKRPIGHEWEIVAAGEVTSDYRHLEVFGDVDGWDLQHCRQVRWKRPSTPTVISGLRRGTLIGVNNEQARAEINQVWLTGQEVASAAIPPEAEAITVDELIDALIIEGLPGQSAELIANTIWRLRRIAKWYQEHGSDVGEHEIRTFLIVPLLTSLGWAEQRIKIEWLNMDVVLFDTPYKKDTSKPVVIIESKRLGDGLRYAPEQATGYARSYCSCSQLVVSDGIRYKSFMLCDGNWSYSAYMNLLNPKRKHPYEEGVKGAVSFFRSILPSGTF